MRTVWTFNIAQQVVFGQNAVLQLGEIATRLRAKTALIVTDPILKKAGLLDRATAPLTAAGLKVAAFTAGEAYTAIDNADFPLPAGERSVYQGKHPMGDICAEKAITLVGQFLRRAVKDGNDLEAREGMALAALMAGMAFSNVGVALVHAM